MHKRLREEREWTTGAWAQVTPLIAQCTFSVCVLNNYATGRDHQTQAKYWGLRDGDRHRTLRLAHARRQRSFSAAGTLLHCGPTSVRAHLQVAAGACHTLLSTADGAVYGFGSNVYGELGMAPCQMLTTPTRVEGLRIGECSGRDGNCRCLLLRRWLMDAVVVETGPHHALAAGEHTSFVGTATSLYSAGNE